MSYVKIFLLEVVESTSKTHHTRKMMTLATNLAENFRDIPEGFAKKIGSLGERVGTHPLAFVIVSLLAALNFGTGLQRIQFITDIETLFVPHGAQGLKVHFYLEPFSEFLTSFPFVFSDNGCSIDWKYFGSKFITL